MSSSSVVRLDTLRVRREQRLQRCLSLHRLDAERHQVVEHLASVARLLGSDRVAAVWIDEYGPGLVHPHVVLDLVSDIPRRRFAPEPLRMAWSDGVPGKADLPDLDRGGAIPLHEASRSLCAVALGSDGTRAWFLVADGFGGRLPLDEETSGRMMFLAGECAGVLLHRDLPEGTRGRPRPRFAGWSVLQDVEGREEDEAVHRRISGRFLVARLLRTAVDEDFALDPTSLVEQLRGVRREFAELPAEDQERPHWDAVLGALDREDWGEASGAARRLARAVELQGHVHGARELYLLGHAAAVVSSELREATECARSMGRLLRRQGEWGEAIRWYEAAREGARLEGDRATEAVVLNGWGSALRDRGNLPGARRLLGEGLDAATGSGDAYALAAVHHSLMTVERLSGRLSSAVAHGWRAVKLYPHEEQRHLALVSLAACFVELGEFDAAEDSYTVVAERVARPDWRFAALESLAQVASLRGDRSEFERRAERSDAAGWRGVASTSVHAQILRDRGLGWRAVGDVSAARNWLEQARDYAEEHSVNQVYFECVRALEALNDPGAAPAAPLEAAAEVAPDDSLPAAEWAEIRGGVGALRRELAPV